MLSVLDSHSAANANQLLGRGQGFFLSLYSTSKDIHNKKPLKIIILFSHLQECIINFTVLILAK